LVNFEQKLCQLLNTDVNIKDNNGKGKLIISYSSLDNLRDLLAKMNYEV
jgi:hypothetical protein